MPILQLFDKLPDAIAQPSGRLWSVFARSLGEQGAAGRTALAWRWALTGMCPSPVTLSPGPGSPPGRAELLADADASAQMGQGGIDAGGQVMQARFVLKWLVGEIDALPLWNGGPGTLHVTDGAEFAPTRAEVDEVYSWALLAQLRYPWRPETAPVGERLSFVGAGRWRWCGGFPGRWTSSRARFCSAGGRAAARGCQGTGP